jgi:hypothetical protein
MIARVSILVFSVVDRQARGYIDPRGPFGFFDHLARILRYLPGDADEFAVVDHC